MNWDAIGAIAELVGATAVVLTLVYLARETAKNSKAIDATSSRSVVLHTSAFNAEIARDPELTKIFLRSYQLQEQNYTEEEWFKFVLAATSLTQQWQVQIMQGELGLGNEDEIQKNVIFTASVIKTFPAWQKFWHAARDGYPSKFVKKIENCTATKDLSDMLKPPSA